MTTLEEAWGWYTAAREGARWLTQLAVHWPLLPWGGDDPWVQRLEADNTLRHLEKDDIETGPVHFGTG